MKITAVKVFLVDGARINWVIAKVETDAGIYGVGDGTVGRGERAVAATIEYFSSYLVGQDPFQTEMHADAMTRDSYWRTGVVHRAAIAALEAAMLDIKGRRSAFRSTSCSAASAGTASAAMPTTGAGRPSRSTC